MSFEDKKTVYDDIFDDDITDTIAPDDKPKSLPPATLKAISDALAEGKYLEEVNCYWYPTLATELLAFQKAYTKCSLQDFRKRHWRLKVANLPKKEADLKELQDALPEVVKAELACEKVSKNVTAKMEDISYLTSVINATKNWKPERRIVVSFTTNDHTTDKTIEEINKNKNKYPTLASKIIQVINFRKNAMEEMNKKRSNPMRNIYINIVLTPMDFKADCSWTIHRSGGKDDWTYYTHYLHTTEYNLSGKEVVEFKSREQLMTEEEKKKKEDRQKLKKVPYEDYYMIGKYNFPSKYTLDDVVLEEDWEEKTLWNGTKYMEFKYDCLRFIFGNVNLKKNTIDVLGYMVLDSENELTVKKGKVKTIQMEAKKPRAKQSELEKTIAKKNLTQNYNIDVLL